MVAVYIDPLVCHTWLYWVTPECWGVVIIGWTVLPAALALAIARRRLVKAAIA